MPESAPMQLRSRWPQTASTVFVFPSRTDTFGNVIIEAPASHRRRRFQRRLGDLRQAALAALGADRSAARERAMRYTWKAWAEMFMDNVRAARADCAAVKVRPL